MGFRFKKSFKVAPGIRMSVGKKSASISVGSKYHHTSVSTTGRRTSSTGIPGTGITHVSTSGGRRSKAHHRSRTNHRSESYQKSSSPLMLKVCGTIMIIIGVLAIIIAIAAFSTSGSAGIVFLIAAIPCILLGRTWLSVSKKPQK